MVSTQSAKTTEATVKHLGIVECHDLVILSISHNNNQHASCFRLYLLHD